MYTQCYKTVSVVAATEFKPCELWLGIGAHLRSTGGQCSRQDAGGGGAVMDTRRQRRRGVAGGKAD